MKTLLLSCLGLLMLQSAICQNLELFLGGGFNQYYTYSSTSHYDRGSYERGEAFSLGVSVSQIRLFSLPTKFTARLESNQGLARFSQGGRGGGRSVSGDFRRTRFALGFYPFDFSLFNRLQISIGGELQFLLTYRQSGEILVWNLAQPNFNQQTPLTDTSLIHQRASANVNTKLGYKIYLSENWYLLPRYEFYLGIFQEIALGADAVSSTQHFLSIGLVRVLP